LGPLHRSLSKSHPMHRLPLSTPPKCALIVLLPSSCPSLHPFPFPSASGNSNPFLARITAIWLRFILPVTQYHMLLISVSFFTSSARTHPHTSPTTITSSYSSSFTFSPLLTDSSAVSSSLSISHWPSRGLLISHQLQI